MLSRFHQRRTNPLAFLLQLITPYLDVKIIYYDLGLPNRDKTNDKVTEEAAYAIKVRLLPNAVRIGRSWF